MILLALLLSQLSPTKVCDPTVNSKCAPVTNATPGGSDYGLNVRVVSQPAGGANVTATQGLAADGGVAWDSFSRIWDGTDQAQVTATNGGALQVECVGGTCGGAATFADNSAFTAGTSGVTNVGGVFNDGLAAVTSGNAATPRITSSRAVHTNLRNNSGTEVGTAGAPLRVDPTGSTAQPITDNGGSLTVDSTQLPVALVGGRLDDNVGSWLGSTAPSIGSKTSANSIPVVVASDQGALTVSGTVTTSPPSNASANVAQFGGNSVATGTGASGVGIPRVTVSNDSNVLATQSGTWAVNNTQQGTAAQNITQFGGTNLSTGTGAGGAGIPRVTISSDSSLAANQSVNLAQVAGSATATGNGTAAGSIRVSVASDSTGTIASTQSGTWTVQPGNTANTTPWLSTISQGGNAATVSVGGALKVDGSGVNQPITVASLPLPSGAATDSTLSQLLDGGVLARGLAPSGLAVPIAVTQLGVLYVQQAPAPPLNPFLPRCNPVRRTGCQP